MPKIVSGFVLLRDCKGAKVPVVGRPMYAQPDQPAALFFNGVAWTPQYSDPAEPAGFQRAIKCVTDAAGFFSFSLPQTSETVPPVGAPHVKWIITDPISNLSFVGEVLDGLPTNNDVHDLVTTYGWVIVPQSAVTPGSGNTRSGIASFVPSSGLEIVVPVIPPMPSANYSPLVSNGMDDLDETQYTASVVPGWSASQFTIHLSASVEALRTVKIPWAIIG